jgi:hypothetical protein
MEVSWKLLGVGIGGQLAGHAIAWGLAGTRMSEITSPSSLTAIALSLGSELAVLVIGDDGITSLLPNVAQVGAIAATRGVSAASWKDPQVLGSAGSAAAKTLYAFQR